MAGTFAATHPPERIAVATDFSAASMAALSTAADLARALKRPLSILHIFQFTPQHRYVLPVDWMVAEIRDEMSGKLQEEAAELQAKGVPHVQSKIVEGGLPADEIL